MVNAARVDLAFKPRQSAPETPLLPDALNRLPVLCCEIQGQREEIPDAPAMGKFVPRLCVPLADSDFKIYPPQCWCFGLQELFCSSPSHPSASFSLQKEGPGMVYG